MGGNNNRFFIWYNNEEIKTLIEKYGTDVKEELIKKIKEHSLSQEQPKTHKSELEEWKLRKLKAETLLKEHELNYIQNFGSEPSREAKSAMRQLAEHHAKKQSINIKQPDGTLKCLTCGKIFPTRPYDFQQADDYLNHVKAIHQRELYLESERPIIAAMMGVSE